MSDMKTPCDGRFVPNDLNGPGGSDQDTENNRGCMNLEVTSGNTTWNYPGELNELSRDPGGIVAPVLDGNARR